ncbi:unnamed protein product, partial [Coregonus sp. 'balchen']
IRPYVGCLVQYLPLLWKQSEEHNMLRCAILTTLIHLVQFLSLFFHLVSSEYDPEVILTRVCVNIPCSKVPVPWTHTPHRNLYPLIMWCADVISCVMSSQGLGAESKNLYPFLLPVIQLSTDVSQPPHVYLLEDGLELWLVTLENSPAITPELLRIFQNMSALL